MSPRDVDDSLKVGDIVTTYAGWQTHPTVKATACRKLDPSMAPVSTALGVLGMPGRTAFFGLLTAGKPVAGETVVVSGAAGAVGSLVSQIAKIKGCRVVGIAGTDAKCDFLKSELGLDEAVNYRVGTLVTTVLVWCGVAQCPSRCSSYCCAWVLLVVVRPSAAHSPVLSLGWG
jgi:NADPH:quinone reductase